MPDDPNAARRPRAALVLLAAGEGRRSGQSTNKVLLPLAGRRVFTWSLGWGRHSPLVHRTVLVIREQDRDEVTSTLRREVEGAAIDLVAGGDTRHASEWQALQALAAQIESDEIDVVVIHDAARPLAGTSVLEEVVEAAAAHGGAIPVRDQPGLITTEAHGEIPPRVVAVQTPQAFAARPLLEAYRRAAADGFVGTDTASCMERYTDVPVRTVRGDARNVKITFPEDFFVAERLLARVGFDLTGPQPGGSRRRRLDALTHRRRRRGTGDPS